MAIQHSATQPFPREQELLPGRAADLAYLAAVGERVRESRARRGMSRKILARDSGVSERYLALLESGRGNISILLLKQIAQAMNVPVEALARSTPDAPTETALVSQWLARLPAADVKRAWQLLRREFGPRERERRRRIALIGLRGSGKTTLGAKLAAKRGVAFVELDREIERAAGVPLAELFLLYGQAAYRRYERRCLESLLAHDGAAVIATGGGLVSEAETFELLLSSCYVVWLKAKPDEHMARVVAQGDQRPMTGNREAMDDLKRILAGRESLYGKADTIVDTSGSTVTQSLRRLERAVGQAPRAR
jgi:XRE family aerobic/anaerobic benzoate catabolism transcriptional regulator